MADDKTKGLLDTGSGGAPDPGAVKTTGKGLGSSLYKVAGVVGVFVLIVGIMVVKHHFSKVAQTSKVGTQHIPAVATPGVGADSHNVTYKRATDAFNKANEQQALRQGGVYIPVTGGTHDRVAYPMSRSSLPPMGPVKVNPGGLTDRQAAQKAEIEKYILPMYQTAPSVQSIEVAYVVPGSPKGKKGGLAAGANKKDKSGNATHKPLVPPGTLMFGVTVNQLDSDHPGPFLGEIVGGKYDGDKVLGGFKRDGETLTIQASTLVLKDGTPMTIQAIVVRPDKSLTNGIATYVNNHVLYRYGMLLGSGFLQGFGQAAMMGGSTVTQTPYGSPMEMFNGQNTTTNVMYGIGTAAQQLQNVAQQAFNTPTTVKVAPGTPIGLLFTAGAGDVTSTSAPTMFPPSAAPSGTQPQAGMMGPGMMGPGMTTPGLMPGAGAPAGMPMMPMMP